MAFSLESRVPFLDHRLAEFVARLPDSQRIYRGTTKILLRNAMRNRLPAITLAHKDKMGYPTPGNEWLKSSGYEFVKDVLHSQAIRDHGVFDVPILQDRFDRFCQGKIYLKELWRWISTEVWMRTFLDSPIGGASRALSGNGKPLARTVACAPSTDGGRHG